MRKLLMSSIALLAFSVAMILFQFSCKKDAAAQSTNLTKEQILIAKTWRVDKLHHVLSGHYSSYTSGGSNTTGINYDNLRFTFNSDGTGITVNEFGTPYNFTWQFTSSDHRSLDLTLGGNIDSWEMLEIVDNYLHASVNLTLSGSPDNIETFRLMQIP